MFWVELSKKYFKKYRKLVKKNPQLEPRIEKAVNLLASNPQHPGLKSHQIQHSTYGKIWSSWVHGDLRILWRYEGERLVLLLLDIGNHGEVY